jgi:hypothetical protein
MRGTHLWLVGLALAGCAHRPGGVEPAPESQTQALSRDAHPAQEVAEIDHPVAPAAAAARAEETPAARVESAAPPPRPSVAGEAQLQTTAPPPDAPLAPPEPAASDVVSAPLGAEARPPAKLGAEIARDDAELRERVQRALLNASSLSYTAKRVRVDVAQHEVTLRGEVRTSKERKELEEIVRALPGVKRLNNQVALINPTLPRTPAP